MDQLGNVNLDVMDEMEEGSPTISCIDLLGEGSPLLRCGEWREFSFEFRYFRGQPWGRFYCRRFFLQAFLIFNTV